MSTALDCFLFCLRSPLSQNDIYMTDDFRQLKEPQLPAAATLRASVQSAMSLRGDTQTEAP
jgi:hypothetical protein